MNKKVSTDEKSVEVLEAVFEEEKVSGNRTFEQDGIKFRLRKVPHRLMQMARQQVKDPKPPMVANPVKDAKELGLPETIPNWDDPGFQRALEQVEDERNQVGSDALIIRGIELIDPIPDDGWERDLEAIGIKVKKTDKFQRELAFKKYILGNDDILMKISALARGVEPEQLDAARRTFQRDQSGDADSPVSSKERSQSED